MGSIPRDILREHGYPTEWLGKRRIWGIAHCIKKEYETFGNFCDIQSSGWRFRNRIFLFSGFTRNHFMTGVDSHNHAEKRAASKIFVSRFHVFIAGIKGSNHGGQCTK